MQKRILAAILIVLALGLVAGPHPCSPSPVEKGRPEASCHGKDSGMAVAGMGMDRASHAAPTRGNLPAHGHRGPANCCDTFCQHACQMPAIATAQPMAFAVDPIAQTFVEPSASGLPLLAPVFDHVPLA